MIRKTFSSFILQSVPDIHDVPEWVIPSLCKLDVDALKRDLPSSYGDRMPTDSQEWWQDFMDSIESLTNVSTLIIFVRKHKVAS